MASFLATRGEAVIARIGQSGRCLETSLEVKPVSVRLKMAAAANCRAMATDAWLTASVTTLEGCGRIFLEITVLAQMGLGPECQLGHGANGLHGELPGRGLPGEHDRRGAVEDGIGDVTRLGARRAGMDLHGRQHLCRGDDRFAVHDRGMDHVLLRRRDLGQGQLDAEIAARHHDPVGGLHDRVEVGEPGPVLDLGDDRNGGAVLAEHLPDRLDITGALYEGRGDIVHVRLRCEADLARQQLAIVSGPRQSVAAVWPAG